MIALLFSLVSILSGIIQDVPHAFPREGAKKIVDNERVVIWDYTWTLGKPAPTHFHDKDVVAVFMEKGELQSRTPDGRVTPNSISFGDTRFNARNRTHTVEDPNLSALPHRELSSKGRFRFDFL